MIGSVLAILTIGLFAVPIVAWLMRQYARDKMAAFSWLDEQ